MEEDGEVDIYEGLPNFKYDETLEQLNSVIAKLEAENRKLQSKLSKMTEEKDHLKSSCLVLNTNISSLLKTAKSEIRRKEKTISDLREQLRNHIPNRRHFLKRRGPTIESLHLNKKPRLSPRKDRNIRGDGSTPRKLTKRKPEFSSHSTVQVEIVLASDEKETAQQVMSKENAPGPDLPSKETPAGEKDTKIGEYCEAPPRLPSPALPALECPTLFSARMYKRLYGKDSTNVTYPLAVGLSCDSASDVAKRQKQVDLPSDPQPTRILSGPPTSGSAAPTDVKFLMRKPHHLPPALTEVPPLSSQTIISKPFSSNFNKSSNCVAISKTSSNAEIVRKSKTTLKSFSHLESEVGPSVLPSSDPGKQKNPEWKSSHDRTAGVGLLTFCKPPPIQNSTDSKSLAVKKEKGEKRLISQASKPYPALSDNRSKANKTDHNTVNPSRFHKSPGLPGSFRGRTVRNVFAPISNGWNCSQPKNHEAQDQGGCGELKTVPVMPELSVRVEESKMLDHKRVSLSESIFGSPVKWADDSSESQKAEGPANSHKSIIYNLFGSPVKGVDSNSSEHPFSVPPGAYEDSCWTNLQLDKHPSKAVGDACPLKEKKPSADAKSSENCNQNGASKSVFLPPFQSVIKRHVSIFSPLKDSKSMACDPPEETRSNTGLFFPFGGPKYEDSVLGQFDDTAQFVSALAKVDSKISPLNTPVKCEGETDHTQPVIVENNTNPTSFGEVFKKNVLPELQLSEDSSSSTHQTDLNQLTNKPGQIQNPLADSSSKHLQPGDNRRETQNEEKLTSKEVSTPPSITITPPSITMTPPSGASSLRIIHRPNFASSTIFKANSGVKSWFPDRPANIVTPRKTPRLVSHVNRSASPKGAETNVSARVAINDAFLIEQEERVRRWEQDHLYENTIRSSSGSPLKNMNVSPSRKKVDPSGKSSPSKRSSYKHTSPSKSPRRAELRKNLGIQPSNSDLRTTSGNALTCELVQGGKSFPPPGDQITKVLDMIAAIKKSSTPATSASAISEAVSSNRGAKQDKRLTDVSDEAVNVSKCVMPAADIGPPISSIQHSKPGVRFSDEMNQERTDSLCSSAPIRVVSASASPLVMETDTPKLRLSTKSDERLRDVRRTKSINPSDSPFPIGNSEREIQKGLRDVKRTKSLDSSDSPLPVGNSEREIRKGLKDVKTTKSIDSSDSPLPIGSSEKEISLEKPKSAVQNAAFRKTPARRRSKFHPIISRVLPPDKSTLNASIIKPTVRQISQKTSNFKRSSALRPSDSNLQKAAVTSLKNCISPSASSLKASPLPGSVDMPLKHSAEQNPDLSCSSVKPSVSNTTDTSATLASEIDSPKVIRRKKTPTFGFNSTNQVLTVKRISPVTTEKTADDLKTRVWKTHEISLPVKDDEYRRARERILEEFRERNAQVVEAAKSRLGPSSADRPGSYGVSIPTPSNPHLRESKSVMEFVNSVPTRTGGKAFPQGLQPNTTGDFIGTKDGHRGCGSKGPDPKGQLEVEGGGSVVDVQQGSGSKHSGESPVVKGSPKAGHPAISHFGPTDSSVGNLGGTKHRDNGAEEGATADIKRSDGSLKGKHLTSAHSKRTSGSNEDESPPGSRSKQSGPSGPRLVVESKCKIASVSPVRTRSSVRKTILLEGYTHHIAHSKKRSNRSSSNTHTKEDRRGSRNSKHDNDSRERNRTDRLWQNLSQADRSPDRPSHHDDRRVRKPEKLKRDVDPRKSKMSSKPDEAASPQIARLSPKTKPAVSCIDESRVTDSQRQISNSANNPESPSAPTATSGTASTSLNRPKIIRKNRRANFGSATFTEPNEFVLSICSSSESK